MIIIFTILLISNQIGNNRKGELWAHYVKKMDKLKRRLKDLRNEFEFINWLQLLKLTELQV